MKTMKIAFLTLNLDAQITGYNEYFAKLFDLDSLWIRNLPLYSIFKIADNSAIDNILKLKMGEQLPFVLFYNGKTSTANPNGLFILYAVVKRHEDHFTIKLVNWLNWIHNIYSSTKHGYNLISEFNDNTHKSQFKKLSPAAAYKALQPLLTHIPPKFSGGTPPANLFAILRTFIQLRKPNNFTRDYARNVHSRIRNNLKHEYNLSSVDTIDLITDNKLLNIRFDDELCIPYTSLISSHIYLINHDELLTSIITSTCI